MKKLEKDIGEFNLHFFDVINCENQELTVDNRLDCEATDQVFPSEYLFLGCHLLFKEILILNYVSLSKVVPLFYLNKDGVLKTRQDIASDTIDQEIHYKLSYAE